MGKPRLIILIRHAQSEGNKNRAIHQIVPDHRVKLTDEGWKQAEEAGHRLRALLTPADTLQVFTSPYRRTRETTEGILRTLTSPSSTIAGSNGIAQHAPFDKRKITVYEEPRLREQDFGNFQPSSAEMERMWRERADYGHFFYRIPNGESAADAYDRVSGFNESLWRQFSEKDFPSVLVLVTHGLMTRVFLMKWYHWSVEYFEDLRNVGHCEFVLMRKDAGSGKFGLETELRTWSELKRQREKERREKEGGNGAGGGSADGGGTDGDSGSQEAARIDPSRRNTLSAFLKRAPDGSPRLPAKQAEGSQLKNLTLPPSSSAAAEEPIDGNNESDDHPLAKQEPKSQSTTTSDLFSQQYLDPSNPTQQLRSSTSTRIPSGAATPHEQPSDSEDEGYGYFTAPGHNQKQQHSNPGTSRTAQPGHALLANALRKAPQRKPTPEDIDRWVGESGMNAGAQADALGDEPPFPTPGGRTPGIEKADPMDRLGKRTELSGSGSDSDSVGSPKEMGRNAVERLVEEMHVAEEIERDVEDIRKEESGVKESVY